MTVDVVGWGMIPGRCEQAARDDGLSAGMATALAGLDPARAAFGPVIAVPAHSAGSRFPYTLAQSQDIAFIDVDPGRDIATAVVLAERLARARIGLSSAALAAAAQRLRRRTAGGEPTVRKQLIVGDLADCDLDIELLRHQSAQLAMRPDLTCAAAVHSAIDVLDWRIARLFGASGYVLADADAEPYGGALYVSALVAQCWVPRGEAAR